MNKARLSGILLSVLISSSYADVATTITAQINNSASMPSDEELANSRKGFIATVESNPSIINLNQFIFESGAAPSSVNPSLWQQAKLNNISGLFKVSDTIYQIRGFDLANMSIIEGKNGIVIIDTLTSATAARSALDLYYAHRPKKPVVAVIYTHSHVDHFGGVKGIVNLDDVAAGKVQIIAPSGFMEHSISENIYAGNAMSRRAAYMYGLNLKPGESGFIDEGLGKAIAPNAKITLIAPTTEISKSGTELQIAGVDFVFQLTPNTEAPAEMNIYLPQFKALDIAENSSKTLHNFYTLRGAQVRDSKAWANYLTQSINEFGESVQVMFAQHHWPTWGNQQIVDQLTNQRDEILYIHDQTLRLANMGYTSNEIAESITLPSELYKYSYERGYYGTLRHNAKAVYQRYLGYYDGNPANLNPLPEEQSAKKYVEYMGGSQAVLKKAQADYAKGNYRWVATAMSNVVFAEPNNQAARNLEANALEQLGYQAEAGTWRNEYLSGAMELRNGVANKISGTTITPDMASAMTIPQFFDNLSIHVNPNRAAGVTITTNWVFTDVNQSYTTTLHNSVFIYQHGAVSHPDFTIRIKKSTLTDILSGRIVQKDIPESLEVTGDKAKLKDLLTKFDKFDPNFNIVLP